MVSVRGLSLMGALLLLGCPPPPAPPPPADTGPRADTPRDAPAREDTGSDAPTLDAPRDTGVDAPVLDVGVDAPVRDAPDAPDAPSCDMRADCDMTPGCETALGTLMNCQDCADRCMAPAGASAACDFATGCSWSCNMGFANCDMSDGNGCEVNTNTSAMHCGGCGLACGTTLLNAQAMCSVGDCIVSCRTGFGDCDMDLRMPSSNGCEIDTRVSLMHCGGCGMPCTLGAAVLNADPTCTTGMCRFTCRTGFSNCDGNAANGCERAAPTCT